MLPIADSSATRQMKELYAESRKLLLLVDPEVVGEHDDFCVQWSCMDSASQYVKQHTDSNDIAPQICIGLGYGFSGGELKCWNSDGTTQVVDYCNKALKVDGRLPHEVLPATYQPGGKRYSIIYYKNYDRRMGQ